ncbi:hypothetical protein TNCV_3909551 [Trichonephila clavipes]|nr:hypothetical protein TNCV_3909551 [Trichonephila clavipes]
MVCVRFTRERETEPDMSGFYAHFSDRMWSSKTRNLSNKCGNGVCLLPAELFGLLQTTVTKTPGDVTGLMFGSHFLSE